MSVAIKELLKNHALCIYIKSVQVNEEKIFALMFPASVFIIRTDTLIESARIYLIIC